jgi:2-amino-4-hydroxy-6-hydroxymethyldihydropteridine diphosphokinase
VTESSIRRTVYIGIGSNSNPEHNLRKCMRLLRERVVVLSVSAVYETEACGETEGGANYLNAAIAVETSLPPAEFERRVLKEAEARLGRSRAERGEVAIDLDLLAYSGAEPTSLDWLCLPESLAQAHVVLPLADIAPGLRHPITGRSLQSMAQSLRGGAGIRLRPDVPLADET